MSVTYEDNNNKEFTNSSHVEGRRKPTATDTCTAKDIGMKAIDVGKTVAIDAGKN